MLILLTNDDGIHAPGLVAMYCELTKLGEVQVVAPATVQSATGHGITITDPLMTQKVVVEGAFTGIAVEGRPADCVKLAINQLLPQTPDLVVSGMNSGANVGINVIYSGTVAAAIEAAFLGLPSIAVSLYLDKNVPTDYARSAALGRVAVEKILANGINKGEVISVNLPALLPNEKAAGMKVVRQCTRPWIDTYEKRVDPRGREYYWNSSIFGLGQTEDDTDVAAVREKFIAITPLQFDMTSGGKMRRMQQGDWRMD